MSGLLRASSRLSGAGSERSDSPAEALYSEGAHADRASLISYWNARARKAEKSLEEARAALNDNQGVRAYMEPASSDIYKQGRVLRDKMRRWDPANWAQLSMIAMDCVDDDGEDVRETVWETPWVKRALHGKLEEDRAECAEYLATHALRPEKFLLAKMLLRVSGRAMGWMASMFKFDHSAVDADGERLRVRETMHADSKVYAPGIWPTKEINKLIDAEIHQESPPDDGGTRVPDRVNIQSEDRKAAVVRNVRGAVAELISDTADRYCGGWASDGSKGKPHWIMLTMDGAGLTHEDNGVRFAMYVARVRAAHEPVH
jgi:hypothetical protein